MALEDMWPALDYADWAPTKKTLHMYAQMLGKARLALTPPQPEWLNSCLYLDPHGFTTGPIVRQGRMIAMGMDVFGSRLWVQSSGAPEISIPFGLDRCVADIWAGFQEALKTADLQAEIWEKPQETTDATPFSENTHDRTVVPEQAQSFHRLLCSVQSVLEEFRSGFFGRTATPFWWGSFDLAVLLFTGKHEIAPEDRGYIMRYDLDAEHMNAGFWPGSDDSPFPGFYGYLVPQPEDCATAPIEPEHAGWVEAMGEWMMPYEAVRTCGDPRGALMSFLRSVYRVACVQGGWDVRAFEYEPPMPSTHGR